jgi:haloalkane dehalogenase
VSPTPVHRTDPDRFADIAFAQQFPAQHLSWPDADCEEAVRIAVIDTAPRDYRSTFLLLHGEPSWSALYERWIPYLTNLGYRCVAIDLPGFGRSDKPVDEHWYTYQRHVDAVGFVIESLDLQRVNLVVQDWAGPIGLRQLVDNPARFERAFVFNTWLHHAAYPYSDGVRRWRSMATDPAVFGITMPAGRIVAGSMRRVHDLEQAERIFEAPFDALESRAGARAFPSMLPFEQPERGGAAQQERCNQRLVEGIGVPIHLAFGDADSVFTFDQAQAWAAVIPGATIDRIPGAGHFVQYDAPDDCLAIIIRHLDDGPTGG